MMHTDGQITRTFPCFGFLGLPNLLSAAGVTWKGYSALGESGFTHQAMDALSSVRNDPALWANVVSYRDHFLQDAATGLPAVSWVVKSPMDHPEGSLCDGVNQLVEIVNAVEQGPDWGSTLIIVYWDEWGGIYDHVPPPVTDQVSYGFRVPVLLISPFTKAGGNPGGGSIAHTTYSQLSILKTIEDNWALPPLSPKDATANDMLGALNLATSARRPKLILAPRACPPLTAAQRAREPVGGDNY
jgi:phospholipase C